MAYNHRFEPGQALRITGNGLTLDLVTDEIYFKVGCRGARFTLAGHPTMTALDLRTGQPHQMLAEDLYVVAGYNQPDLHFGPSFRTMIKAGRRYTFRTLREDELI